MSTTTPLPTNNAEVLQALATLLEQNGITQQVGAAAINETFFDPNNPKVTNNDALLEAAFFGEALPKDFLVSQAFAPPTAQEEAQIQSQAFAGLNATTFHVQTAPGVSLQAWYIPPQAGKSTILFSNGADGDFMKSKELITQLKNEGYGVLTYQFRGYGAGEAGSSGVTTEQGLYSDLQSLSHLLAQGSSQFGIQATPYSHQVLMGYSLGGDVSAHVAAESGHHYQALALVDAPKSIEDAFKAEIQNTDPLAQQITASFQDGIQAAEQKLQGAFDITKDIAQLHTPTFFVEGGKDPLALPALEHQLFESEKFPDKSYLNIPSADHDTGLSNNSNADLIAGKLEQFLSHADYCKILQDMSAYGAQHDSAMTHFSAQNQQADSVLLAMAGHH
jgi:alpha-beta hydrolase superfamily lysophospholipase